MPLGTASRQDFDIRPLNAALGAEVLGLDLSRPINTADLARVHRAHLDYHVLVFRDTCITPAEPVEFSRRFGELQIHVLLFVSEHFTTRIVDIPAERSRALFDTLFAHSMKPEFIYRHLGPLMTTWDRTNGKQNVRAVASLGNFPYYLTSTNPAVRSIADFGPKDRIALPAVTVSVQARLLQMASARQWGAAEFKKRDSRTQAVPHPDAAAAVIAGGTEIKAHFGSPPFQEQELAANPKAKIVLDSYQVLGGPSSATVLYATEKYVMDNPKTCRAFLDALVEAAQLASTNPEAAADAYLRVTKGSIDRALLVKVIRNPKVQFKVAPQYTLGLV